MCMWTIYTFPASQMLMSAQWVSTLVLKMLIVWTLREAMSVCAGLHTLELEGTVQVLFIEV